ncbi:MAG TPA: tetratricopeptide repeat protein [Balneolaceae bacterium]|nr:tetratricopeptide repeat protein [Balneolaceae bacterium]
MSDEKQPGGSRIKKLAAFIKKNPEDPFAKFALALELLKRDEVEKALMFFESVYNQNPDYVGVYYHLGKLYERFGRLADAEKIYTEGVSLSEKKGDLHSKSELQEALTLLKSSGYDDE